MKHINPRTAINATTSFNPKLTLSAVRFFFSGSIFAGPDLFHQRKSREGFPSQPS
jgi:hypothetical protein